MQQRSCPLPYSHGSAAFVGNEQCSCRYHAAPAAVHIQGYLQTHILLTVILYSESHFAHSCILLTVTFCSQSLILLTVTFCSHSHFAHSHFLLTVTICSQLCFLLKPCQVVSMRVTPLAAKLMLSCMALKVLVSFQDAHGQTHRSNKTMGGYGTRLIGTLGGCMPQDYELNVRKSEYVRGL